MIGEKSNYLGKRKKSLNSKLMEENHNLKSRIIKLGGNELDKSVQVTNVEGLSHSLPYGVPNSVDLHELVL